MPYNNRKKIEVSSDSISDIPMYKWEVPEGLYQENIQRMMTMWLDFARQNMKLKEMVVDIVMSKIRTKCQRCKS